MKLEHLSEAELAELIEKASERLKKVNARPHKSHVMAAIERIAQENGYTLAELFPAVEPPGKKARKAIGKAKVKYVHPSDPTLRWTGRGSKPVWVRGLLSEGVTLEAMASAAQRIAQN